MHILFLLKYDNQFPSKNDSCSPPNVVCQIKHLDVIYFLYIYTKCAYPGFPQSEVMSSPIA